MSDAKRDDLLGSILRRLPGFRGYAQRDDQKASEELTREFVNSQILNAKSALDRVAKELADAGRIDELSPLDKLREALERARGQVDRPILGSSDLLGNAVNEDALEDLYDLEASLMDQAESLASASEQLADAEKTDDVLADLTKRVAELHRLAELRQRALKNLTD